MCIRPRSYEKVPVWLENTVNLKRVPGFHNLSNTVYNESFMWQICSDFWLHFVLCKYLVCVVIMRFYYDGSQILHIYNSTNFKAIFLLPCSADFCEELAWQCGAYYGVFFSVFLLRVGVVRPNKCDLLNVVPEMACRANNKFDVQHPQGEILVSGFTPNE
jgi:hypothetical protein